MKSLLIAVFVILVGAIVVAFASGWITVQQDDQKTTIDIDTREMKTEAAEAVDEGRDAITGIGAKLQRLGESSPSPNDINDAIEEEINDDDVEPATVPVAEPHSKGPDDSI